MNCSKILTFFAAGILFVNCNDNVKVEVKDITLTEVKDSNNLPPPIPTPPTGLKVSANLIYEDSSFSSFDVLNDKSIVLWNTISGAGDATKPSTSIRVRLTGELDHLGVKIYNGKKKVNDMALPEFIGDFDFVIKNTGCEIVKVLVTKNGKTVFENTIPFHCGE